MYKLMLVATVLLTGCAATHSSARNTSALRGPVGFQMSSAAAMGMHQTQLRQPDLVRMTPGAPAAVGGAGPFLPR